MEYPIPIPIPPILSLEHASFILKKKLTMDQEFLSSILHYNLKKKNRNLDYKISKNKQEISRVNNKEAH